jgi:hypothetical protein
MNLSHLMYAARRKLGRLRKLFLAHFSGPRTGKP